MWHAVAVTIDDKLEFLEERAVSDFCNGFGMEFGTRRLHEGDFICCF